MRFAGFLIVISLFSSASFADEATCRSVLKQCDLAVHALQTDNAAKQSVIDTQNQLIEVQKTELERAQAWYRNPAIVIPLSLLVGFAGGVYVTHH